MADLIDRQAAIDEVARWTGYLDEDMITRVQIGLKHLPSAQPEPAIEERKTGKWIRETNHYKDAEQEFYYYEERCSECGVKRKIGWGEAIHCPNCGARMEEE